MFVDRITALSEYEAKIALLEVISQLADQVSTHYVNETMFANEIERQKNRILDDALAL